MRWIPVLLVVAVFSLALDSRSAPTRSTSRSAARAASCAYVDSGALPDPRCTPGAFNRAVTQRTIHRTICVRGWTSTIRPPLAVTEPIKYAEMRDYGDVFGTSARAYELDHLVPLELGGAPLDRRNLWPEPRHVDPGGGSDLGSYAKDAVENSLRARVCAGTLSLRAARRAIRTDWRLAR